MGSAIARRRLTGRPPFAADGLAQRDAREGRGLGSEGARGGEAGSSRTA